MTDICKLTDDQRTELQLLIDKHNEAAGALSDSLDDLITQWQEEFDEQIGQEEQESEEGKLAADRLADLMAMRDDIADSPNIPEGL